ncbi:MAG: M20 family metallopeptidase [Candidatus Woesebacteria bacterium]
MSTDIVELTQQLVAIRSDYPNEHAIGEFLASQLQAMGFDVKRQYQPGTTDRFNILATRGNGDHSVLFYGHQDTVPLQNEALWESHPLSGSVEGDKLFGLGSYDMKGGIAAFLHALEDTSAYTKIFLPFDEEYISEGAWLAIQEAPEFFTDVSFIISPEPNFGLGLNNVMLSRPGRSVYEMKIHADVSHVAEYFKTSDAVVRLGQFITSFHDVFQNQEQPFFHSLNSLAMIRKVSSESVGITAPSEATIQIELYLDASDHESDFLHKLNTIADSSLVLIPRKTPYLQAYSFEKFPYQDQIGEIVQTYTHQTMTHLTRSAVGDDNALATLGKPILSWGPEGENAHAVNEYVLISSLETLSTMFHEVLNIL